MLTQHQGWVKILNSTQGPATRQFFFAFLGCGWRHGLNSNSETCPCKHVRCLPPFTTVSPVEFSSSKSFPKRIQAAKGPSLPVLRWEWVICGRSRHEGVCGNERLHVNRVKHGRPPTPKTKQWTIANGRCFGDTKWWFAPPNTSGEVTGYLKVEWSSLLGRFLSMHSAELGIFDSCPKNAL